MLWVIFCVTPMQGLSEGKPRPAGSVLIDPSTLSHHSCTHFSYPLSYICLSFSVLLETFTYTHGRAHPFFVLAAVDIMCSLSPLLARVNWLLSLEVVQLCQSRSRAANCAHAQRVTKLCSAYGDVRLEFAKHSCQS